MAELIKLVGPDGPYEMSFGPEIHIVRFEIGLTLRDYFAGQALAGMCATLDKVAPLPTVPTVFAKDCYTVADAMLKARKQA